jgi:hypothetical protein
MHNCTSHRSTAKQRQRRCPCKGGFALQTLLQRQGSQAHLGLDCLSCLARTPHFRTRLLLRPVLHAAAPHWRPRSPVLVLGTSLRDHRCLQCASYCRCFFSYIHGPQCFRGGHRSQQNTAIPDSKQKTHEAMYLVQRGTVICILCSAQFCKTTLLHVDTISGGFNIPVVTKLYLHSQ